MDLVAGVDGKLPYLNVGPLTFSILAVSIALKLALYLFCKWASTISKSDGKLAVLLFAQGLYLNPCLTPCRPGMAALTEDHFNDVLSNGFAIITAGT